MSSIRDRIVDEVSSWSGVSTAPHRFGGIEFRLGRIELGHLHGDRLADLPFPTKIRNELIERGQASPHHVLPDSGWVSRWIESPEDAEVAVRLFRINYERVTSRRVSPGRVNSQ